MRKQKLIEWSVAASVLAPAIQQDLLAFPPAPPAAIYGVVRDGLGNPLSNGAGSVQFDSGTGFTKTVPVVALTEDNGNYSLAISMDSGVTGSTYKPNALMPAATFRLKYVSGNNVYVPMEMRGDFATLGVPGSRTRLDLTLGISSDNDGLPDAWKRTIIQQLGLKLTPHQIHPGDLAPGTGLTYYQIYVSGTYYLAPTNGFALNIVSHDDTGSRFTFTAVQGRNYTVQAGSTVAKLAPMSFQVISQGKTGPLINQWFATNTTLMRIQIPSSASMDAVNAFFRLTAE